MRREPNCDFGPYLGQVYSPVYIKPYNILELLFERACHFNLSPAHGSKIGSKRMGTTMGSTREEEFQPPGYPSVRCVLISNSSGVLGNGEPLPIIKSRLFLSRDNFSNFGRCY